MNLTSDLTELSTRVYTGATFPEQVFTPSFGDFRWLEFEELFDPNFFAYLGQLARLHNEEEFYVRCLSPFPNENFGFPGAASFRLEEPLSEYYAFLDSSLPGTRSISIANAGNRFLCFGQKCIWAFYADRMIELVAGAKVATSSWPDNPQLMFQTFENALSIAAGRFQGSLPSDDRQQYIANYQLKDHAGHMS